MRGHQQGWRGPFLGLAGHGKSYRTSHSCVHNRRLRCEPLEQRCLLSVVPYVVNSLADVVATDGVVTLREALQAANTNHAVGDAHAGSMWETDIIRFTEGLSGIILLGGTQLQITDEVEIRGPGANILTIDADGQSRVFQNMSQGTTISGLTITGGHADLGGGISNSGVLTITDSTLSRNVAEHLGGGIDNSSYSTLTLIDSIVTGNVTDGFGGGIANNAGTVTLVDSIISGNVADGDGGGLYQWYGWTTIINSIFSNNSAASHGGGVYSNLGEHGIPTQVTIIDSMFSGNSGDGIYNGGDWGGSTLTLTNSTVVGNSHDGVYSDGTLTVTSSTIAGNACSAIFGKATAEMTMTNSIVALNGWDSGPFDESNLMGVDPHFVRNPSPGSDGQWGTADDDYGDLHLRSDSPAINAGNNALLPPDAQDLDGDGNTTEALPIDLDGNPRVIYHTVDIGAYEFWLTGDLNQDRRVNGGDLDIIRANWGQHVTPRDWLHGDASGDGRVGAADLDLIRANWGQSFVVPPSLPVALEKVQQPLGSAVPYVVDSLDDVVAVDGKITLREALEAANGNVAVGDAHAGSSTETDVIRFAEGLSGTITLGGTELGIGDEVEIQGPGARVLAIDAGGQSGVFRNGSSATISGLTITGGSSYTGGGIENLGPTLTLADAIVSGNVAEWAGGGFYQYTGSATIINSIFSNNSAGEKGGGVYSVAGQNEDGTITIINSTFSANSALEGAGIYNGVWWGGTLTLTNSIVVGNSGDGVHTDGMATIMNSTISGNSGTGIDNHRTATAANCIVALNGIDIQGTLTPQSGFNLLGGDPKFVRNPSPGPDGLWGTADDDYGDLRLRSDSPALNAGSNALLPADSQDLDGDSNTTEPLPIDLDGNPRAIYGTVDIGAYEFWLTGDLNQDRRVGAGDLDIVRANWGQPVTPRDWLHGDANGDGVVGAGDLDLVRANWGQSFVPPPEVPAAPALPAIATPYVVDSLDDIVALDGKITLREALEAANTNTAVGDAHAGSSTETDIITFPPGLSGRITLGGTHLDITDWVEIQGPGAGVLTVDANHQSRVFNVGNTHATISGLTITGGSAATGDWLDCMGGGIYNGGTLTLIDSIVSGNSAEEDGGGIFNFGTLTITNSTFSGNSAASHGGAIFNESSTVTITNSTLSGNSAGVTEWGNGGGICSYCGTLTLVNSKVSGNAKGGIAGTQGWSHPIYVTVENCTIAGNSGGGIVNAEGYLYGLMGLTVNNSIVALNAGEDIPSYLLPGPESCNLIGVDPLFVDLAAGDLHLRSDSPAINAGSNALLPADSQDLDGDSNTTEPLPIDLDGNPRVVDATVDIGAYEWFYQEPPPPPLTGDLNGDGRVGGADLDIVRAHWGMSVTPDDWLQGDASGDGHVGGADLDIVRANWGGRLPAAEPYVVDSLADVVAVDGKLTLREALEAANTNTPVGDAHAGSSTNMDIIRFKEGLSGTITLGGTQLSITDRVEIQGPGANLLTIDAARHSRVFSISTTYAALSGLTITGGSVNGSAISGGGIYGHCDKLTLTNVSVLGNSATGTTATGGGITLYGELALTNVSIVGNSVNGTTTNGGAIYGTSGIALTNVSVVGNSASGTTLGGGICSFGPLTVVNSILALNSGRDIAAGQVTPESGFNLIGDDPLFVRNPSPGPDSLWGTADDDYGDLHLRSNSPAINAGSNALLPADALDLDHDGNRMEPLPIDLAGDPRIVDGTVDIGAYEGAYPPLPPAAPVVFNTIEIQPAAVPRAAAHDAILAEHGRQKDSARVAALTQAVLWHDLQQARMKQQTRNTASGKVADAVLMATALWNGKL